MHASEQLPLKKNTEELKQIAKDESLKVLVTPMWAWNAILKDIHGTMGQNVVAVSLYQVFAFAELYFCSTSKINEKNFMEEIKEKHKFPFSSIGRFQTRYNGYSLLLYLLYRKDWRDTCFVFDSGFSESIISRLRDEGCVCLQDKAGSDEGAAFDSLLRFVTLSMPSGTKFYGEDEDFLGMKHFLSCDICIIEDRWNADYEKQTIIDFSDIGVEYITNGYDNHVKNILVTEEPRMLPNALRNKAICVRANEMWNNQSASEQERILRILGISESTLLQSWKWGYQYKENKFVNALHFYVEEWNKGLYEYKWKTVKEKYHVIRVFEFVIDVLGETIFRFFDIIHDESLNDSKSLNVFLPRHHWLPKICNIELINLLRQSIYIPSPDELPFWVYVYKRHPDELDLSHIDKYVWGRGPATYKVDPYVHKFTFSNEQKKSAEKRLKEMCITKPFVCFMARSTIYNREIVGDFRTAYDFRNMNFDDYGLAIEYLKEQGITSIRMGRGEERKVSTVTYVNYAGLYADDFMDLYLTSHCKFIISNNTGFMAFGGLFHIPLLIVNCSLMFFAWEGSQNTKMDQFVPRKYYDTKKEKYLSLREMFFAEQRCYDNGFYYEREGIRFLDNTSDEIRIATQEFLDRLEGRWVDTELDKENYRRYKEIYDELMQHPFGVSLPLRPSATYLRANPYLLE